MTIQVTSTTEEPKETENSKVEESKSAPEPEGSEQNESPESETEENDAKEQKDDAEDEESEEGLESKESDDEKPRKKGGFQRRIDKLNAARAKVEQEREYWKAEALKKAGESKPEKVEPKHPVAAEGKPNPDNFDTHADYVEALTDWKTEQKLNERDQRLERSKLEIEQENVLKSHVSRVKSFAEKTDDFSEVMESVDDIPVSPALQELIVSSDHGPALMYELAKNREEFERIANLPPLAAAREMGKLEARFFASPEKKPEAKKLTSAPRPLDPVGKGASGTTKKSIYDPDISQAEYERRREQMRRAEA